MNSQFLVVGSAFHSVVEVEIKFFSQRLELLTVSIRSTYSFQQKAYRLVIWVCVVEPLQEIYHVIDVNFARPLQIGIGDPLNSTRICRSHNDID